MNTADVSASIGKLFSELTGGATARGEAFVLNSGDVGLLRSVSTLSATDASQSVNGGATIAAHTRHLAYGLGLMNRWAREGGDPFSDARWDEAWKTSSVDHAEWQAIQADLRDQVERWQTVLGAPRDVTTVELSGMIASIAHLAYHLGAIRQINKGARGPREGTFR